ncbi:MAG: ROK family protein, partial [Endomicrobia bacterium]|nr:ROK family protein [Endomicrobiia bacterium]
MNKFTLGIDIGGTTTKIGLVSRNSKGYELIGYREIPTICGKENINRMLDRIKQEIYLMKKKRTIHSCGIGIAALVNVKKGFVIFAPNVLWSGVNLKKIVQKKFQIPTVIENDANVATVGIYHKIIKPKYPDIKDIVCFTLGTGIGGGIILQGQLLYGNLSTA